MDTRLIAVLIDAAVVVLAARAWRKEGKRQAPRAQRELRGKARHERTAAEKHRATAEAAEELARERAERYRLKLNCRSAGPARSIRTPG
jgi:hypothetical protein